MYIYRNRPLCHPCKTTPIHVMTMMQLYNMNYVYLRRTYLNIFPMVQVEPNMYLLDLSSSSEESLVRLDESEISSRSTRDISSRCQNIRRKFHKCMEYFLAEGVSCSYDDESCSYDDETIGDIEGASRCT